MITQEITYYPDTFQTKEYKEYYNGVLNVHTKYDENNNKVYLYLAYDDVEWERRLAEGTTNDNGRIVYYKDNKGNFIHETDDFMYGITIYKDIPKRFEAKVKSSMFGDAILLAKGFLNGTLETTYFEERLPNGDLLKYNHNYFHEIYYEYWVYDFDKEEYRYTGKRKIISFDKLMELTQFKDFLVEQRVCPVTSKYLQHHLRKNKTAENLFFSK